MRPPPPYPNNNPEYVFHRVSAFDLESVDNKINHNVLTHTQKERDRQRDRVREEKRPLHSKHKTLKLLLKKHKLQIVEDITGEANPATKANL